MKHNSKERLLTSVASTFFLHVISSTERKDWNEATSAAGAQIFKLAKKVLCVCSAVDYQVQNGSTSLPQILRR